MKQSSPLCDSVIDYVVRLNRRNRWRNNSCPTQITIARHNTGESPSLMLTPITKPYITSEQAAKLKIIIQHVLLL